MNVEVLSPKAAVPNLADKVAFLGNSAAYGGGIGKVACRETHMSWVFLAGERVYKLKKPVRFPYLDFSTLERREAVCRSELELNRRLAPDVYLDVVPLSMTVGGLAIGRPGRPVDWLVLMRRLDERQMLDRLIGDGRLERRRLDRLAGTLARFYAHARPALVTPATLLAGWNDSIAYNRRVLLDPRFTLPAGLVRHIDRVQCEFLQSQRHLFTDLVRNRWIVEGHGDLRPEHVWLGETVKIIDCLEFNARLRMLDPFDEIAYLGLECERLGAAWAGEYLKRRMEASLGDSRSDALFDFYRCHRATLRARLAIAHLLEPDPRTPDKWPRLAAAYLELAKRAADRLSAALQKTRRSSSAVRWCRRRMVSANSGAAESTVTFAFTG